MKPILLVVASCLLTGCATATAPIYSWGTYEDLIYASYVSPNDVPAEKQVEQLQKDYQMARSSNRRMPPGWHAHLGALYYQLRKPDQARQELMTEKAEFPESSVFVDRLIANLMKP